MPRRRVLNALSALKFQQQLHKSGLPSTAVQQANLKISRGLKARSRINGSLVGGNQVTVRVSVVMDNARAYHHQQTIFVAPHDPKIESRRHTSSAKP